MAVDAVCARVLAALLAPLHPGEAPLGGEPDRREGDVPDGDEAEECQRERYVVAHAMLEQRRRCRTEDAPTGEDAVGPDPGAAAFLDRRTLVWVSVEDANLPLDR